ncbi:alpha carbonic anhydrase 7-like [Juglans microcarpa x Juglans regia]|uniref:alpha carbonic anhydrase 7-like n=1 Tax=Juglans microcarpa x Juglans regia TaxID=2249226 RepID=UPI001B7F3D2F|nr:alpha carbonic anhydrase 7-like [Juglans microcarpa x Juglans regia]
MKNPSKSIFISSILIFVVLFSHLRSTASQEVEDEREFDYLEGSEMGPRHWGDIRKEWAACKNGDMQSPIDLSSRRVKLIPKLGELKRSYKLSNATIKNRGHDISVQWVGDAGYIQINGTDYSLQQGHWHSPSEHSINGRRYDLELHMVHLSQDINMKNKIVVDGLFYKIGRPDAFLSKLMRNIRSMADEKVERNMGVIDPTEIKMGGKRYYRYMGSLTVPPCTEGVTWIINKKVRTVSRKQVKLLREVVHDYAEMNARPVQPLNRREVHLYGQNLRRTKKN